MQLLLEQSEYDAHIKKARDKGLEIGQSNIISIFRSFVNKTQDKIEIPGTMSVDQKTQIVEFIDELSVFFKNIENTEEDSTDEDQ